MRTHKARWIILSVVVLIIIAAAAAGSSSKKTTGTTSSPALVTTSTPSAPVAPVTAAAPQTFKGNGSENIGTINVPTQSTLHWSCPTCANDNFSITNNINDAGTITVNALGPVSGDTALDADTYHDVQVITEGQAWTIKVLPGT